MPQTDYAVGEDMTYSLWRHSVYVAINEIKGEKMKNKYRCESVRLCRFLYGLGFDKKSIYENGKELWLFEKSDDLQKSLDFFFSMRKKLKNQRIK